MNVLLVGAGRMGQRHRRGLEAAGAHVVDVDPRPDAGAAHASLDDALARGSYDAAVLAETAAGRLERFRLLAEAGISRVLVEKPVEQSRARVEALAATARAHGVDARVNHFFRALDLFAEVRAGGGPFHLTVTGGAFGLACNGIHWIDLALYLSGDGAGRLLHGELDAEPIGSGRGPQFRDYGGRALYGFADGSRLYLDSAATGSAPMHAVIDGPARQTLLFPHEERAVLLEREPASDLPSYRYGAGYAAREVAALAAEELSRSTQRWLEGGSGHPSLELSARAHGLLFDLLETSGEDAFAVT